MIKLYTFTSIYADALDFRYYFEPDGWQGVDFDKSHLEAPRFIVKKPKPRDTFFEGGYNLNNTQCEETLFWPDAFAKIAPFLMERKQPVQTILLEDKVFCFRLVPVNLTYAQDYPTYAQISAQLPEGVCYFNKFPGVEYPLLSEDFVAHLKQLKIKGLRFTLRFDGKQSYPALPPNS
jgi:hypothetical protein